MEKKPLVLLTKSFKKDTTKNNLDILPVKKIIVKKLVGTYTELLVGLVVKINISWLLQIK